MATGWPLGLLLAILLGSALVLLAGAVGLGQYLRLRRRRGDLEAGPAWLAGTARAMDGEGVTAPVSGEPALCVEWTVEREGGKVARRVWRTVDSGRVGGTVRLETEAGAVRLDPADASLDLAEDYAETFDDPSILRETVPAPVHDVEDADRYRLTERRIDPGDDLDATGHLGAAADDGPTLAGPDDPSIPRRLFGVPFVLADPDRDGGAGVLRDRALAGFVLGVPPALLALVLLFPP